MRRTIDAANVTINVGQLAAILGLAWLVATTYERMVNRIDGMDQRLVQTQAQIGEVSMRLATLEGRNGR